MENPDFRTVDDKHLTNADVKRRNRGKIVAKTNQVWMSDVKFRESVVFQKISDQPLMYNITNLED